MTQVPEWTKEHHRLTIAFFDIYDENMTEEQAKKRYKGMYGTEKFKVLKKNALRKIWDAFLQEERIDFLNRHNGISIDDILRIGIDVFIRTLGWEKPSDVHRWRNNVVRLGICGHCRDQFLPMMFQVNHGLCDGCRPQFSTKAIQQFVKKIAATSDRYHNARGDLMMDFYIMFYSDDVFRSLFRKGSDTATEYENMDIETPDWLQNDLERQNARMQARMLKLVEPTDG